MRHTFLLTALGLVAACSSASENEDPACTTGAALVSSTTKTELEANNTAASGAFRDRYTPAARFDGASIGVVSNGDMPVAQTTASSLAIGSVSKLPIRSLLYPGSTTKIFAETQSWFCTNGVVPIPTGLGADQCGSHIDIGYGSADAAHVKRQVADMQSRGIQGVIADWEGQGTSTNQSTIAGYKAAAEASGGTFEFAIMEDEGMKGCAAQPGCDVTQAVLSDIAYANTHFFSSSAYYRVGGKPVLFFFSVDAWASKYGKSIDWSYVRAHAAGSPLFVFENAGGFGHAASDGAYSWLKTTPIASYPGTDPFGTTSFLPGYYNAAHASGKLTFGSAYKGFDDHVVNGWQSSGNGERYDGQQCGKTWLDTFKAANAKYSSANQLAGLQLVTWDDYEEGSELETGIDNHVAVGASVSGATLSWTIGLEGGAPADCTKAVSAGFDVAETIHHFTVYASPANDGENLSLVADDLPRTTRALDLTGKLPSGSYVLYVRAVGEPSIKNHLSAPVPASGGTSSSSSSSGGSSSGGSSSGGDGCSGAPAILEPTAGQSVGPSIRLRASAPSCIDAMIAYIDGQQVVKVAGSAIDQWVPVTMGPHTVNVNGWAGTATAHVSPKISFTRTY